ncbi:MAG: trypsin-like serine peptidase [Thermoanaerobaculia bacterium]
MKVRLSNIALIVACVFHLPIANYADEPTAAAAIAVLRDQRGKSGEIRSLVEEIRVSPGHPGPVETAETSTYLAIHLRWLVLRGSARVRLLDAHGREIWSQKGDIATEDVWLPPVAGESAVLVCETLENDECDCEAIIDQYARGFSVASLDAANVPAAGLREICGPECELTDTICPSIPAPLAPRKSAVVRLLLAGTDTCSGFLAGDQGHMITNVHCIASAAEVKNVIFEFGAEESSCPGTINCDDIKKAPAERFERGAHWIGSDPTIDVAIVKVPSHYAQTYGYLRLRRTGPSMYENLAVIQHPRGESRKYTIDNIRSTTSAACVAGLASTVAYMADTRGGSSGSPVISLQPAGDSAVIAVHECVGCPNRGISSSLVVEKLGHLLPPSAFVP